MTSAAAGGAATGSPDYRADVDGLRAVAVIAVMLFHGGIAPFGGGFIGVDVFFVISGYLITSLILARMQAGTFTLAGFYEARARRILPALLVVCLVSTCVAGAALLPPDLDGYARSLLAVLGFASNLHFWGASGYFDAAAELSPLLHTWSLAVEEQYYLLFPLAMLLLARRGGRALPWAIGLAAAGSLAVSVWASTHKAGANFFLLPTRAWEILLGAGCGWLARQRPGPALPRPVAEAFSGAGLVAICVSCIGFDRHTPSPGLATLVPTLGTAALLLFAPGTRTGRLLASRPFVAVGLISYSAYLWHQPLYAFARHLSLDPLRAWQFGALGLVALVLGAVSWRWLETPFRNPRKVSRRVLIASVAVLALLLASVALAAIATRGFLFRLDAQQQAILATLRYPIDGPYAVGRCFLQADQGPDDFAAECRGAGDRPVMVWGDSHAAALSVGLADRHPGLARFSAGACPPVLDTRGIGIRRCGEINARVLDEIARLRPRLLYLHANWNQYRSNRPVEHLDRTIAAVSERSPETRIMLVGSVPQWHTSLPGSMLRTGIGLTPGVRLRSPYAAEIRAEDQRLAALARRTGSGFRSAFEPMCEQERCLAVVEEGGHAALTAWDYGHLTTAGSRWLVGRLESGPP